jgi:multicomponent Na+:H+ antiporter subunit D
MGTVLLTVSVLTMVIGVFGAIAQDDVKRILAFHIVSQIGYMIFGLGLFTLAGIAGAIFYMVHHIAVKTTLFLVAGLIGRRAGSTRLSETGGLIRSAPAIAALFAIPALGLAGFPPFSGFVSKFGLLQAGFANEAWVPSAVSLAVGLLTMYSMSKIWNGAFWGEPEDEPRREPLLSADDSLRRVAGLSGATLELGLVSVSIALFAGPLYELAERAAVDVLDRGAYVEAVFGDRS